jgi:CDP-6-deoxy-D-xylo-4-hexulose-3-dehydrase
MEDNITNDDINSLVHWLTNPSGIPRLTNGPMVKQFEEQWSNWLGVKYSLFVNSGASANELTMLTLNHIHGGGEIIIPPLTWISDIASVLFAGYKPVFCDINLKNLSFDIEKLKQCITKDTRAIFLTHVLGINGLTDELMELIEEHDLFLIEDVCESHGTTWKDKKVGTFGLASNFSFYFAHHMSTIEGGMICTDNEEFYQVCKALRSHGMVREMTNETMKNTIIRDNPDLNKDFIFLRPSHNFRSTEINAVLGINQLRKLNRNNSKRQSNFIKFIKLLDNKLYVTDLEVDGQCNYAFIIILKSPDIILRDKIEKILNENGIEFRRGLSGGGNQLRQPYMKEHFKTTFENFPNIEHVHNFSWYVGNYPSLDESKLYDLIWVLNNVNN